MLLSELFEVSFLKFKITLHFITCFYHLIFLSSAYVLTASHTFNSVSNMT